MFRKGAIRDPDVTLVHSTALQWEAELAKGLLENAGISVLMMDREDSGGYLRILGVGSPFGMDLYVKNEDAERAKQLLADTLSGDNALTEEELEKAALEAGSNAVNEEK